ncbi:MAG: UDP-N-acetylmuramoyl-tripeptide--D-alanyl-D-alanine ligase, partial [Planctomycetota bacterium]
MEPFALGALQEIVGGELTARAANLRARGVCTDTRALDSEQVFFALRGERFDGAAFVGEAFARGAVACVVDEDAVLPAGVAGPILRVADARRALGSFAAAHRRRLRCPVVAVTGSAGKTTTKDMIHTILGADGVVCAEKSFNNDVGVPLTLLRADADTRAVVLEVGTNAPGEIDALGRIARPDLAVITCIGASHLEGLGSIEGVAREKLSLLRHVAADGAVVLSGDDLRLRGAASGVRAARGDAAVTLCGFGRGLDWRAEVRARGARWRLATWRRGEPGPDLDLPLPGRHVALDALLALAVAERLGVAPADAARALAAFQAPPGRLNVRELGGVVLIDDTYNANPTSVCASLEAFASLAPPSQRLAVLGTMHELGAEGPARHEAVGRFAARAGLSGLVCVGEGGAALARGARRGGLSAKRVRRVPDAADAADALADWLRPGAHVLFKASRADRLE